MDVIVQVGDREEMKTPHFKTESKATASSVGLNLTPEADPGNEQVIDPANETSVPVTNGNNQKAIKLSSGPVKEIPNFKEANSSFRLESHMTEKALRSYSFFLISLYPPTH